MYCVHYFVLTEGTQPGCARSGWKWSDADWWTGGSRELNGATVQIRAEKLENLASPSCRLQFFTVQFSYFLQFLSHSFKMGKEAAKFTPGKLVFPHTGDCCNW